jgi:hypothetical protein
MVDLRSTVIFNCSFQSSKNGKTGKLFAENGLCETRDSELTMAALTIIAAKAM